MAVLSDREAARLLSRGLPVSEPALAEKLAIAEANLISALQARNLESQLDFGDTAMLRRFLVARKLQIEPTVEMLLKHLDWRKATLPIELTPAVVTELKKGKTFLRGRDLQGRPLVVIRSACFDPKTRDLEASVKAFVHELEEALRSMPEGQSQLSIFYDRTGFRLRNLDLEAVSRCVKVLSDNYPERMGATYVFPAGTVASAVFKIVSPFMDARTASKVQFVKSAPHLCDIIPPESIPVQYGGTAPDAPDVDAATEPDVSEPDVTEPDVTEPDVTEPDVMNVGRLAEGKGGGECEPQATQARQGTVG